MGSLTPQPPYMAASPAPPSMNSASTWNSGNTMGGMGQGAGSDFDSRSRLRSPVQVPPWQQHQPRPQHLDPFASMQTAVTSPSMMEQRDSGSTLPMPSDPRNSGYWPDQARSPASFR
ncbi:hypothetical protein SISSUDRAFT_1068010 [Sistotremastrum suecicum HHB10207 ss-3]|uniref:Uncharacterized protein n=1 Tax=Sistotremastrum suecicum HHB10207 ss-3 TaxID=1314776 RepID=A0A165WHX5_9AGAM|nr:hypothetical protein SISSUDRAFT_1068010 [Sistotremastrum suecicum HHB10207 ss-3]